MIADGVSEVVISSNDLSALALQSAQIHNKGKFGEMIISKKYTNAAIRACITAL